MASTSSRIRKISFACFKNTDLRLSGTICSYLEKNVITLLLDSELQLKEKKRWVLETCL